MMVWLFLHCHSCLECLCFHMDSKAAVYRLSWQGSSWYLPFLYLSGQIFFCIAYRRSVYPHDIQLCEVSEPLGRHAISPLDFVYGLMSLASGFPVFVGEVRPSWHEHLCGPLQLKLSHFNQGCWGHCQNLATCSKILVFRWGGLSRMTTTSVVSPRWKSIPWPTY